MAKNPNRSPNKGWLKELNTPDSFDPKVERAPAQKPFTWDKPVSGGETRPNQMNVPRRLNEQKQVGRPKSNLLAETQSLALKKKGRGP